MKTIISLVLLAVLLVSCQNEDVINPSSESAAAVAETQNSQIKNSTAKQLQEPFLRTIQVRL